MAVFENFPYTNYHELNLDWVIQKQREHDDAFSRVIEEATDIKDETESLKNAAQTSAENAAASAEETEAYRDAVVTIKSQIDTAQEEINETVEAVNTSFEQIQENTRNIAVNSSRIDQLSTLAEGSTTGDAELQDIRVAANGKVYPTAGDAVRAQYDELNDDITYLTGSNVVVYPLSWTAGGYIDRASGQVRSYTGWKYTDFVEINGVNPIRFTTTATVESEANNTSFYDESQQYISFFDMRIGDVEVPANAKYFRVSVANSEYVQATAAVPKLSDLASKDVENNFEQTLTDNKIVYDTLNGTTTSSGTRQIRGSVYLENGKEYIFRFWKDTWEVLSSSNLTIERNGSTVATIFSYTTPIPVTGFTFTWDNETGLYDLYLQSGSSVGWTVEQIKDGIMIYPSDVTVNSYSQGVMIYSAKNAVKLGGKTLKEIVDGIYDYSIVAYGDSLVAGSGSSGAGHRLIDICEEELGLDSSLSLGYGGSASKAIAFTAGALSGYVPPNSSSFALKYADLSSDISIALNQLNGKDVLINDEEHTIYQTEANVYSLDAEYTPSDIWLPITVKNSTYTGDMYVIWMGTNDGGLQFDIIDALISKLPHKRYVVMGLTRLGTDTSVSDELKAYEKYGSHFFNTRVQIINNAFPLLGLTPTAEDTEAMNAGLMPPSLLSDSIHFNDNGYEAIGKLLAIHIRSLNYMHD